jgi:hypothetical protein
VAENLIVAVAKSAAVILYDGRRHRRVAEERMARDIRWDALPDVVLRGCDALPIPSLSSLDNGWRGRGWWWRRIVRGGMSASRQRHERQQHDCQDGIALHDFLTGWCAGNCLTGEWHSTNCPVWSCRSWCFRRQSLGK